MTRGHGGRLAGPDVFLVFCDEDRPVAVEIAERLTALGLDVWSDTEPPGHAGFDPEIAALRYARCVLVCWTPAATRSDWLLAEAAYGREHGNLVAATLRPCEPPESFASVPSADLRMGPGPVNPEWLALLGRIGPLVGRLNLTEPGVPRP